MLFNKKKKLTTLNLKDNYIVLKESFSLPVFINKEASNYYEPNTKREFLECLKDTKLEYFKKNNVNLLCMSFANLKAFGKKEAKIFFKDCKQIIKLKLLQLTANNQGRALV